MTIVYILLGKIKLAIAKGLIESISIVFLYWGHERVWYKIKWGKKKIEPFNIWFTGLPLSGKTTIADIVFIRLQKFDIAIERIDSKDTKNLIPKIGFTKKDRIRHTKRVAHLIQTLQKNSISTVCSFVSPYEKARDMVKKIAKNTIIIYKKNYEKAIKGEIKNFIRITDIFDYPLNVDMIIDIEKLTPEKAPNLIISNLKKKMLI